MAKKSMTKGASRNATYAKVRRHSKKLTPAVATVFHAGTAPSLAPDLPVTFSAPSLALPVHWAELSTGFHHPNDYDAALNWLERWLCILEARRTAAGFVSVERCQRNLEYIAEKYPDITRIDPAAPDLMDCLAQYVASLERRDNLRDGVGQYAALPEPAAPIPGEELLRVLVAHFSTDQAQAVLEWLDSEPRAASDLMDCIIAIHGPELTARGVLINPDNQSGKVSEL